MAVTNSSLRSIPTAEHEADKMKYICMQARLGYMLFGVLGGKKLEQFGYPDKTIIEILRIVLEKTKTKVYMYLDILLIDYHN